MDPATLFAQAVAHGAQEGVHVVVHLALVALGVFEVESRVARDQVGISRGTTPMSAQACTAAISTLSQEAYLFSSDQTQPWQDGNI